MPAAPFALALLLLAAPPEAVEESSDNPFGAVPTTPTTISGTDIAASARIGDRPLFVWHSAGPPKKQYLPLPKPFMFPLYTPSGVNVLDYASADHPHHKGVWVSVDEVELHLPGEDGAEGELLGPFKHWVEAGRIETQEVNLDPKRGTIRSVNHWLTPDGTPVLKEETTINAQGLTAMSRADDSSGYVMRNEGTLIEYDITLSPPPGGGTVTIGDTKEGFVGVRMAPALDVKRGDGVITNSEGGVGEKECWGKVAAWCDCSAPATEGAPGGGVALFDHPDNFRKARYHARGYGLMAISPFGPKAYTNGEEEAAPVEIKDPLRLRYAVYVHDGDAKAGDVAGAYQRYVGTPGK
ncbi:PmoA family protein [Alienimonas chondri]|uniref:Methane oxygenase PmoA n=1 Tax=Alienimonas chondri TaxID=2681879 RepID=A0ABX1VL98_9PLAN|nr:PmoA family protein [Alienimonas chondri]NNJ27391.1 hypothetical protein [Alienimonas chondri]